MQQAHTTNTAPVMATADELLAMPAGTVALAPGPGTTFRVVHHVYSGPALVAQYRDGTTSTVQAGAYFSAPVPVLYVPAT